MQKKNKKIKVTYKYYRGQDHVVGLDLCLRHSGSVVFVMPFMRHDKFSVNYISYNLISF